MDNSADMTTPEAPGLNAPQGVGFISDPLPPEPADMALQLELISTRSELIQLELERTHEQLQSLQHMTSNADALLESQDPRQKLLRTWGHALDAAAIVTLDHEEVSSVAIPGMTPAPDLKLNEIPQAFKQELAQLANHPEPQILELNQAQRRVIGGGYALLAAPFHKSERPTVWLTIRHWSQAPFDASDVAVAVSAVTYGGLIQESSRMMNQLERNVIETVRALANAIDAKDRYTHGHSQRVSWLAKQFGRCLNFSPQDIRVLEWAGLLHDVGKIGIPETILCKAGELTPEEIAIIQQHPQMSYDVIAPVESLRAALPAVLHHHENFDGSGYPGNLSGYQTPLFARMLRIVDVFDALTSRRSYRGGFSIEQAREVIVSDRKKAADPELTDEFVAVLDSWLADHDHEFHVLFGHIQGLRDSEQSIASSPNARTTEEPELITIVQEPRI